jgi:apolipoprotein N-acyltransferase
VNSVTKERIKHSLFCLLAGALLPFAFAPYEYSLLAIITVAFLFFQWIDTEPRTAFLYGYAFGFGLFGVGVNWLHISINLFGGVNLIGALFFTYLLIAFIALYPALVGYLSRKYFQHTHIINQLILIPSLWTLSEWCRAWIFTGFPWLNLGYSQIDSPLTGLAAITGVYGISWMVCFSASVLVYIFLGNKKQKLILTLTILFMWSFIGYLKDVNWTTKKEQSIKASIIQGGIPQQDKWKKENQQYTRDMYLSLSTHYLDSDLIIWPETAIPALYHQADFFIDPILELSQQHNIDVLTGIPTRDLNTGEYFNSIISIDNENEVYHKRHLVPFGEYLPFDKWTRPVLNFLRIPMSNFSAGQNNKPILVAAGQQIGVSICYEDAFGEEIIDAFPEASLLVNISNDAWFGDSFAPHQHLQMARMRSLETGRYMLRATNTGISAIINEKGKILLQSPQFKPHALSGKVALFESTTPYAEYGNYPVLIFSVLLLVIGRLIKIKK